MHMRETRYSGVPYDQIENTISHVSDLLSTVTSLPGFRDAYVAVSRQRGQVSVFTVWDSEKAMQDSEVAAASGVTEAVGGIGGYDETPAVERFEVVKHETW